MRVIRYKRTVYPPDEPPFEEAVLIIIRDDGTQRWATAPTEALEWEEEEVIKWVEEKGREGGVI